ncbi:protein FAM200C-like [Ciona intestinalis]
MQLHSSTFDIALENKGIQLDGGFKIEVETHLRLLKQELERYFPDLNCTELAEWKMTRNPFRITVDILPDDLQEEFLEMQCSSAAKDDFETMLLTDFWAKYMPIYKNVGGVAMRILPFSSTYLCESGFSTLVNIKTQHRNKLDCGADVRCALSATKPKIKLLVSQKQLHSSH